MYGDSCGGYSIGSNSGPPVRTQPLVSSLPAERTQPVVEVAKVVRTENRVSEFGPRVEELLASKKFGLYAEQVEVMYQRKWSSRLPEDWVETMERERAMKVTKKGNRVCSLADGTEKERDWSEIVGRVEGILLGKNYGEFVSRVENIYTKLHKESLPDGWERKLEKLGKLEVDRSQESVTCCLPNTAVTQLSSSLSATTIQNTPVCGTEKSTEVPTSNGMPDLDVCLRLPDLDLVPQGLSLGETWALPQVCQDMDSPELEDYYDVRVCLVLEGDLVFFVQSYMNLPIYAKLQEDMETFYSMTGSQRAVNKALLTQGSLVAVWHEERWERGRVLGCLGAGRLSVCLVDCGQFIICSSTTVVRPLVGQFGLLPAAARCARLAEVQPMVGEEWSRQSKEWFRGRVQGSDMVAVVERVHEKFMYVRLVDTSDEELQWGEDIGEQMVGLGLARRRNE